MVHVILDNYRIHSSQITQRALAAFDGRIRLHFLPPYCPELNLIEILWRMIKYHWLPLKAYTDFKTLLECLNHILVNVGTEYRLQFA